MVVQHRLTACNVFTDISNREDAVTVRFRTPDKTKSITMQLNIFEQQVFLNPIPRMNNVESQKNLEDNIEHFRGQNLKVFNHLMTGQSLDNRSAMDIFYIEDLGGRIRDIKAAGYRVSFESRSKGSKLRYMSAEDIEFNKNHKPVKNKK